MNSEKVKEIKELLRCMNGEKPCTDCYINDIAKEQETCCINVVADMTLDLINELESENESCYEVLADLKTIIKQQKDRIALLEKDNELLRNAKVVYETVDYCYEDLKKAENRIAELEREIEENAFYSKGYAQGIKNTYEVVVPDKLKQFAERLKDDIEHHHGNYGDLSYSECGHIIDETLKEFVG